MRIMTVPAVHRALAELVTKWAFEARAYRRVAVRAEGITRAFDVGTVYAVATAARDRSLPR